MLLDNFKTVLSSDTLIDDLRDGLIGEGVMIPGEDGPVPLVYADYVASGRALVQVEDFIRYQVLPYYANSHTEASYCGAYMTNMREEARGEIARITGAQDDCSVIFTGSGATSGLNRLVTLLGIEKAENPVVFIGPYEHHSNMLPWRESRALVIEIPEGKRGGPDLEALEKALEKHRDADLKIGSFSAASNVTGIITDPDPVTRVLKRAGAISVWDYAGGAPYLPIDMKTGTDAQKDAVVMSAHKFVGGPAASGVLILRKSAVHRATPSQPGGGTVAFVSPWNHDYVCDLSAREEAGTPNVVGDIRTGLVFLIKEAIGQSVIDRREAQLAKRVREGWADTREISILGHGSAHRLPIFSFLVRDGRGNVVSEQAFTTMLSDLFGIQVRGGCACAGPYGHRLLEIDHAKSDHIRGEILAGHDITKPGWVRLNLSYVMDDKTVDYIIASVKDLAENFEAKSVRYSSRHAGSAA